MPVVTPPRPSHRLFLMVLLGSLLVQTAWILALPAFRGSDEFDHVFKADAVAHGQLLDDGPPSNGRGGLVTVRREVVAAASDMCASYAYTGPDNCHAVEDLGSGDVTVASAASRYNPTYYAVVGVLAQPFDGAAADFAMRAYSAILAALLLAWAAVVTAGWARNAWPLLALLVSATPVLLYSTAVAAPNGVGYAAGCLLWAAGLGLVEGRGRPPVAALTTAALTVMVAHTTGVVWLTAIVAVIGLLQPGRAWHQLLLRWPQRLAGAAFVVVVGALACVAWIVVAKPNARGPDLDAFGRLGARELLTGEFVWTLQTIAAFPLRRDSAPTVVYLLWLIPFVALLALGLKLASGRTRAAGLLMVAIWTAVPVALTIWSFGAEGLAWQGRYALPLAVGFPALAGLALHRSVDGPRRIVVALAVVGCAAAQVISVTRVAIAEADKGLAPTFAAGTPAAIVLIAALALTGALIPLVLTRSTTRDRPAALRRAVPVH